MSKPYKVGFWPEIPYAPDPPRGPAGEEAVQAERKAKAERFQEAAEMFNPTYWDRAGTEREKKALLDFLRNPDRTKKYRGHAECWICGKRLGSADYFRDEFVWPQGFEHYILAHDLVPTRLIIDVAWETR